MEVGTALGATFCGALVGNKAKGIAIDTWEENIQPFRTDVGELPENNLELFKENVKTHLDNEVEIINQDLFKVDLTKYSNQIDMWFYDGPHSESATAKAVEYYSSCFSEETVLIFDDANWMGVVTGAKKGIEKIGAKVAYEKLIMGEQEDPNGWWNGLYVMVVRK